VAVLARVDTRTLCAELPEHFEVIVVGERGQIGGVKALRMGEQVLEWPQEVGVRRDENGVEVNDE